MFGRDDHNRLTRPGPPHQDLSVVGVGFDHGVGRDGFVLAQHLRLFLGYGLQQPGSLSQRSVGIHLDVQTHAPAHRLQHQHLAGRLVDGHQPRGETLVPPDAAQHGNVAVAHGDAPRHAGVEVIVHADGELGVLLGRAHHRAGLGRVAVPRVVDAVRVADGLNLSVSETRQLPAGPAETRERVKIKLGPDADGTRRVGDKEDAGCHRQEMLFIAALKEHNRRSVYGHCFQEIKRTPFIENIPNDIDTRTTPSYDSCCTDDSIFRE